MSVFNGGNGGGAAGFLGGSSELVNGSADSAALFPIRAFSIEPNQATLTVNGLVDQVLRLTGLVIPEDMGPAGFVWLQDQQGAYTADNENRIGAYTSDGTDLTLVQSTANDGNLWKAAVGEARKAAADSYQYTAGQIIWIGTLFNNSAVPTAPNLVCGPAPYSATAQKLGLGANEAWNGYVSAQATLPSSIAWSSVTSSGLRIRLGVGLY